MRPGIVAGVLAFAVTAAMGRAAFGDSGFIDLSPGLRFSQAWGIAGGQVAGFDTGHATLWDLSNHTSVDLNPAGADASSLYGSSWAGQVGVFNVGSTQYAAIWHGTVASVQILNTSGYYNGQAQAIDSNGYVVGSALVPTTNAQVALLWTAANNPLTVPIALPTPGSYATPYAMGINGDHVAGYATALDSFSNHAVIWNIANPGAPTFADLNPAGFDESYANAVYGQQVVGYGNSASGQRPLLWTLNSDDSVASVTDLTPAGFTGGEVWGIYGPYEVGGAMDAGGNWHPMLWSGTAASAVDLSSYLPPGAYSDSQAYAISADGEVVGMGEDYSFNDHAIAFGPVVDIPEPASFSLLTLALPLLLKRRRYQRGW